MSLQETFSSADPVGKGMEKDTISLKVRGENRGDQVPERREGVTCITQDNSELLRCL